MPVNPSYRHLQTISHTILSCQWEREPCALQTPSRSLPALAAWKRSPHSRGNDSTLLPSTWILYPHGANWIFYCFVAQWFFTRMLIWHFNKLCEWLQCCGGIAPICLTADPLAGAAALSPIRLFMTIYMCDNYPHNPSMSAARCSSLLLNGIFPLWLEQDEVDRRYQLQEPREWLSIFSTESLVWLQLSVWALFLSPSVVNEVWQHLS